MSTLKKVLLIVVALLLAAALAALGPQSSAREDLVGFVIVEQMPPTYLAYTQCTQMVDSMATISWIRTEVLDTDQENAIVAHEHVHQAQMRRFSRCPEAYKWYRSNRIIAEAEAYCKSARVYHSENPDKVTLDGAIYDYAKWLKNYDPGLTLGKAIIAIKGFCDGET